MKNKPFCKICKKDVRFEQLFSDGRGDAWCLDENCGWYGAWPHRDLNIRNYYKINKHKKIENN